MRAHIYTRVYVFLYISGAAYALLQPLQYNFLCPSQDDARAHTEREAAEQTNGHSDQLLCVVVCSILSNCAARRTLLLF
jgi:hypothetical protein